MDDEDEKNRGIAPTLLANADSPATMLSELHSWIWHNVPSRPEVMLRLL